MTELAMRYAPLYLCALALAAASGFASAYARAGSHRALALCASVLVFCTLLRGVSDLRSAVQRRCFALALGLLFGATESGFLLSGLPQTVQDYFQLGPRRSLVAVAVLGCAHALRHGMWTLLVSEAHARRVHFGWVASLSYVALSWLWPRLSEDQLAAGVADVPVLKLLPAWGGPQLSDFVLVASAALCAAHLVETDRLLRSARCNADRTLLGCVLLWLATAAAYTVVLHWHALGISTVRIAALQPNRAPLERQPAIADEMLLQLSKQTSVDSKVALVVGPESALIGPLAADPRAELSRRLAALERPHLLGAELAMDHSDAISGSALLIGARGRLLGRYDKKGLMPFAERTPFVNLLSKERVQRWRLPHAEPGVRSPLFTVSGLRIGVLICYEDLLPEHLFREFRGHVPDVIVALVNDGWFRSGDVAHKHEAQARIRAVEWARPLVRVTQSGSTAWFDASGARRQQLPHGRVSSGVFELSRTSLRTPFSRLGPWPGPLAWLLLAAWPIWRRRRVT